MSEPIPAWYADPVRRHQFRYWDGVSWTNRIADDGVAGVDDSMEPLRSPVRVVAEPIDQISTSSRPAAPPRPQERRAKWPWVLAVVVLALAILGGAYLLGKSGSHQSIPLTAEQQSHAIQRQYFDNIPLGLARTKLIAALGKQPEDPKTYVASGAVSSSDLHRSCIYYNQTGASFGHRFEFCFTDDDLSSKTAY